MAKNKPADLLDHADTNPEATKHRVLVDGVYGKCNDVILLGGDDARSAIESGQVDASPEAVEYAESLAPRA